MWEAKRAAERERSIVSSFFVFLLRRSSRCLQTLTMPPPRQPLCDKPTHNIHDFGPCKAIYPRHIVSNNASSSGYTLCYPSAGDGGFWLAQNEHPATLQHLGINRFNTSLSTYPSNPDVEDAFCHRFKQAVTTATYFPSANKYLEYGTNGPLDVRPGTESHWRGLFTLPRIATCWPEDGGVWVMPLQTPSSSSSRSSKLPPGSVVLQQKLNAALTTEERCYVLKRHGAGFYLEPSQSPFLKERVGVGEELLPPRVEIGLSYSGRSRWRPLRKIPAAYVYRDERYWRGGDML